MVVSDSQESHSLSQTDVAAPLSCPVGVSLAVQEEQIKKTVGKSRGRKEEIES